MPISRGLYNQILDLESPTVANDGMGGQSITWASVGTFRGRISPIGSEERQLQNKPTQLTTHRIYCDNMTIDTSCRIKWGTYYFQILGIVNPSELYDHLEIEVREIGPT